MHTGLGLSFQALDGKLSDADIYRQELALAARAEPDGFDSIWTPEHHFTDYMMTPNVPQFLRMGRRTDAAHQARHDGDGAAVARSGARCRELHPARPPVAGSRDPRHRARARPGRVRCVPRRDERVAPPLHRILRSHSERARNRRDATRRRAYTSSRASNCALARMRRSRVARSRRRSRRTRST